MHTRSLVFLGAVAGVAIALAIGEPQSVFSGADARPASASTSASAKYRLHNLFTAAFERVRMNYVEKADETKLIYWAINGLLAKLEDSSFSEDQTTACTGSGCPLPYGGVGFDVRLANGLAQVISAIDDSPAAKAGVMARDVIAQIDDESIQDLPLERVMDKLRGPAGKEIRLKLLRGGRDETIDVAFLRDSVPQRTVRRRNEGDIGYIRISRFEERTGDELKEAIDGLTAEIRPERLKGFVLDLRNNPGGPLEQAVAVADAFLDSGAIVSVHSRKARDDQSFSAKPGDLANGKPMVVLINAGSASAAEIVAGALKDNHRATLVGTRSFGEGSFSSMFVVGPTRAVLRLTTGHYFTPSGRAISGNGIIPDIEATQDLPEQLQAETKPTDGTQPAFQSYVPPDLKDDKALIVAHATLRGTSTAR